MKKTTMKRAALAAAAAACLAGPVQAMALNWTLTDEYGGIRGTFRLDFLTESTSHAALSGDLGTYTIPSFTFLDSPDNVGSEVVDDFLLFFSPESGQIYFSDYGGGEYSSITLNESAMQIGTLSGPLSPLGGTFDVIIHEIYNYDESYRTCAWYEEIYDSEGEYLGEGPCAWYDTSNQPNIEAGYWYYGTLSATPPAVPLPAGAALMGVGLGALVAVRRRRGR